MGSVAHLYVLISRDLAWIIGAGAFLAFVNAAFMGMGADVSGAGTLPSGLIFAGPTLPVFVYRHYIQDKGLVVFITHHVARY